MAGYLTAQTHPWIFNRLFQPGPDRTIEAFRTGVQIAQFKRVQTFKEKLAQDAKDAKERHAEGLAELSTVMSSITDFTDPEAQARFWAVGTKHPTLVPQMRMIHDSTFENAARAKQQTQLLTARQAGQLDVEGARIEGRLTLEQERAKNRETLLDAKFLRLAELQEDSQEHKELMAEITHEFNLERDANKPHPSGQARFDLPYSDQLAMKAELDAINKDLFAEPEAKAKKIEVVYRKWKAKARQPAAQTTAPKVLKFNPASGAFE